MFCQVRFALVIFTCKENWGGRMLEFICGLVLILWVIYICISMVNYIREEWRVLRG